MLQNNVSAKELEEKYAEMLGTRTWVSIVNHA